MVENHCFNVNRNRSLYSGSARVLEDSPLI